MVWQFHIGIEGVGDAGVLSRRYALVEPSGNENSENFALAFRRGGVVSYS